MKFNFDWNCVAAGAPYITVSNHGLGFNALAMNMLENPDYVAIGFDENALVIGIRAASQEDEVKTYRFADRAKNGWVRIGCKDFIKYLSAKSGISFSPAKRYVAEYDATEELIYVTIEANTNLKEGDVND